MKRIVLIGALALSLAGCAEFQNLGSALTLVTKSAANPVTKTDLYKIETDIDVAMIGLTTYRKACIAGAVDTNCKANIRAIQQYTRQFPPYIAQLRSFVKQNDQVNAVVVYNNLKTLYTNASNTANSLGVKFGGQS